jgi:bifunctional DNA-binding transcriptional regulator/antitoxin component of YhaV-PrlF toxin-antitoxin module
MKTVVAMDRDGTITVPEELRHALDVDGPVFVELEIVDHSLVLRPGETIPEEDLWAYTPEHLALVERARQEGRGMRMSPDELERLIEAADR